MPRQPRIQYEGAFYHVMARGDRKEAIVRDDADRRDFVRTLGKACDRTGWRVHAWVLMENHYHLLLETPLGNLVDGMRWLQNTYTRRFNVRNSMWGHVFGGRYKAILLDHDDEEGYYYRSLLDYIHLNPARAGLLSDAGAGLVDYKWSSLSTAYAVAPTRRPDWVEVSGGFAAFGCRDTAKGRRTFAERLEERVGDESLASAGLAENFGQNLQSTLRRGWYWGSEVFKEKLLGLLDTESSVSNRDYELSPLARDHTEKQAEKIVADSLARLGISDRDLEDLPGNDSRKVEIAAEVWARTSASQVWLAKRLRMGSAGNVSLVLHRRAKNLCKE